MHGLCKCRRTGHFCTAHTPTNNTNTNKDKTSLAQAPHTPTTPATPLTNHFFHPATTIEKAVPSEFITKATGHRPSPWD